MGDHRALLVDRLLTESTLEEAIGSKKLQVAETGYCYAGGGTASKMVECRICQEEDWDTSMEAPCACCGSLKYAHRKCIQRWCNEKGDTTCEICLQPFKPGYTAPHQLFHYGSIPMDFRGNWEIARRDLNDSQVITMVPSGHEFMGDYEDYLPVRTRSSAFCCRTSAIVFMALLVLRHTLPFVIGGNGEYSIALFSLLVLRTAGILFPILVMVRALATFVRCCRQQESQETHTTTIGRKKRRSPALILHGLAHNNALCRSTDMIKSLLTEEKSQEKFQETKEKEEL